MVRYLRCLSVAHRDAVKFTSGFGLVGRSFAHVQFSLRHRHGPGRMAWQGIGPKRSRKVADCVPLTDGGRMFICLVRGCGDVGSAVAYALFGAGHRVVIHDRAEPYYPRRGMAFVDAMFDGKAVLEGVIGKRARDSVALQKMLECGRALPLTDAPFEEAQAVVHPDVLIDARMRKRAQPQPQIGVAPLTIGLGPNFTAGETTDLVVETSWGDTLGRVITSGTSRPLGGELRAIAGHGRDRFIYAPAGGRFQTSLDIGARVSEDDAIGSIGEQVLRAPLSGTLRGLTRNGVWVDLGTKVIEVDPRGDPACAYGIGERPRRIAMGVLNAIAHQGQVRERS